VGGAQAVVEQAGGIVFRVEHGAPAMLVVTSKRDPSHWIFPKGHIEAGETAAGTALRETVEESGVSGDLVGSVGAPLEFEWAGKRYRVQYFLIRATSEGASLEGRQKAWLPFEEALARLSFEDLRALLREAVRGMKDRG
jgi:8-oxo-dGTP pyrophosphatase MutT (NUDIX family)